MMLSPASAMGDEPTVSSKHAVAAIWWIAAFSEAGVAARFVRRRNSDCNQRANPLPSFKHRPRADSA